jgi:hypothetical protein
MGEGSGLSLQLAPSLYHVKKIILNNPKPKMKSPFGGEGKGRRRADPPMSSP